MKFKVGDVIYNKDSVNHSDFYLIYKINTDKYLVHDPHGILFHTTLYLLISNDDDWDIYSHIGDD